RVEPATALGVVAVDVPEPPERSGQPRARLRLARLRLAPGEDGSQVVVLGLQPCQPPVLLRRSELRLCLLGQPQEVGRMPSPEVLELPAHLELLERELADRLQHPEPWLPLLLALAEQALVDQRPEPVQHVDAQDKSLL